MKDILMKDITSISKLIEKKELSPLELTRDLLEKIKEKNKDYNAYITISKNKTLEQAENAEKEIMNGNYKSPLHGIPISIKDNMDVKGFRKTNGSIVNANIISLQDASSVSQLRSHGAIIAGKANMDEFANNISGINNNYGNIKSPVKNNYTVGGSSGGSAASVATNLAFASLGTDTSGSVRIPASCCGIYGLKPTYNLISVEGVTPLSWSLDHVGVFAKSSEDISMLYQLLSPGKARMNNSVKDIIKGLKIGVLTDYDNNNDSEIKQEVEKVIRRLTANGAEAKSIKTNFLDSFLETHFTLCSSEAYYFHQQFLHEHEYLYEKSNVEFFRSGANVSQQQYFESLRSRRMIENSFQDVFSEVDLIITPTLPILPPHMDRFKDDWEETLRSFIKYTGPMNMSGLPALSIPYGKSKSGLPIGIQLVGNKYNESLLLEVSNWLNKLTESI